MDFRKRFEGKRFAQSGAAPKTFNAEQRSVDAVLSRGSPVQRSFGTERLRISPSAVDLTRLEGAGIPLLDSHQQSGITNAIGRFVRIWFEGDTLLGRIVFNQTDEGERALGMVGRGEITSLSVGYIVSEWQITDDSGRILDPDQDRIPLDGSLTFTAQRWTLFEASLVSVPADAEALIRSFDGKLAAPNAREAALARMQARQRMIARQSNAKSASLKNTPPRKQEHDEQHVGARSAAAHQENIVPYTTHIIRDEREGVADAMELAIVQRILASRGRSLAIAYQPKGNDEAAWFNKHRQQAAQFRDVSLVEIAARCIGYRARRGTFLNSVESQRIFERAFSSTTDFPNIFQNALNKSLLARYQLQAPTYREVAAERTFNDFRPHPQVRAGDFPMLQEVQQNGELKYGSTTDSGETISVTPYGIIFTVSRQMLINDDLGAIDQILGSAGDMVLVFENNTFWAMFNSNPVLKEDNTAVFASAHGNLAASGAAPSVDTLGAGRAALRKMLSISGNKINVPPAIILAGPAQETAADQLVASITPTLTTSVNPFSGKLRSVADANISNDSWYLFADPSRVPCFVYGFLAGSGGPRTRIESPFGVQGVKVSLEHDFGVGAIDYRGAYKNPGS